MAKGEQTQVIHGRFEKQLLPEVPFCGQEELEESASLGGILSPALARSQSGFKGQGRWKTKVLMPPEMLPAASRGILVAPAGRGWSWAVGVGRMVTRELSGAQGSS